MQAIAGHPTDRSPGRTRIRKRFTLHTFSAEDSAALAGPQWLRDRRVEARQALESSVMPAESEEVWRYTPIDELNLDEFEPVTTVPAFLPEEGKIFSELVASTLGPLSGQVLVHNGYPLAFSQSGAESTFSFGGANDISGGPAMVGGVRSGGDAPSSSTCPPAWWCPIRSSSSTGVRASIRRRAQPFFPVPASGSETAPAQRSWRSLPAHRAPRGRSWCLSPSCWPAVAHRFPTCRSKS